MRLITFLFALLCAGMAVAQIPRSLKLTPLALPTLGAGKLTMPLPGTAHSSSATASNLRVAGVESCTLACTLPVKWLKFSGERRNDSLCALQWETTNEVNSLGFYVERSFGSTDKFETAGFMASQQKAEALLLYDFADANTYSGITYYRLRQVDINKQFSYSKTIAVKGYTKANGLLVYPNPVSSSLQAVISASVAGPAEFTILDGNGKTVLRRRQPVQKGTSLFRCEAGGLANGTYLLQVVLPGGKLVTAVFIKS